MARTITDEKIKLSIIIDGNTAQKELLDLEKATRKLNETNKDLLTQRKRLEAQGKKDTEEWKKLDDAIKKNSLAITENKTKMGQLQNEIGITGLSMTQLRQKATVLRMTLNNLIPGSADYERYKKDLTQVTNRINELNGKAQQSKMSLSSMADGFNKYQGLALSLMATLTGVVFSIQKIIDINGKLSDAQADVMKTTGMNKKEVDELTKSFGLLETRTSRIDLLKIAEQGGRIGIMKEDIGDFVNVMNQATVSLGDSFTGGAEEVANKLGKIKFLFSETKDLGVDKAYNAIGSAINDLGANGVASEANIAEFTTRIGSLTDVLKPSIQETLALGAAFEESGIEAEVSARAYNIFMKQASTESAKFAKVMGISQKAVEDMINTDPLEFMLKFAEGMRGMDATKTAKTLDYLGINADGANKVIGAMGNNMERFRELIDLSNNSFAEGTSLADEYKIKNENLAATLEKISKRISGFFSSEGFIQWLGSAVNWIAKFIGAAEDADGTVAKWRTSIVALIKIITTAVVGFASYRAALSLIALITNGVTASTTLLTIAQRANALSGGTLKALYLGLQYVFYTLTLQQERATIAANAFNIATKMNPIGLVIGLLAAAATAYMVFSKQVDQAAKNQKNLNDVRAMATQNIIEEKNNLDALLKIAKDETQTKENRLAAIKKINELSPEYLGNLTLETINTNKATTAINSYLDALEKKAMKEAFGAKRAELAKNVLDTKSDEELSTYGGFINSKTDFKGFYELEKNNIEKFKQLTNGWNVYKVDAYKKYKKAILDAENQLVSLSGEEAKFIKKNATLYTNPVTAKSNYNTPEGTGADGSKKDPNSSLEDIRKLQYEDEAAFLERMRRLREQNEDARIAAMEDGYAKELEIENRRFQRQIDDLERQKVHEDEFIKMDAEVKKAKKDGDITKYQALLEIKEGWVEKNKSLDAQINSIELSEVAVHNKKLSIIEEKAATDALKKKDDQFKREKLNRETDFNNQLKSISSLAEAKALLQDSLSKNELSKIKTLDQAKAALREQFNNTEQQKEVAYLNELLKELDQIVNSKTFEGINLELLTPEQKKRFEEQIDFVKNKISQLKNVVDEANEHWANIDEAEASAKESFKQSLGNQDILGFTADQWTNTFDNLDTVWGKMQAGVMVIEALRNAWGMYDQFVTQTENRQIKRYEATTNTRKTQLKAQLDSGIITQKQHDKAVEVADKELDRKKTAIEYKQAKRKRAIALADVALNTAKGVMSVMSTGGGAYYADFGASAAILSALVIATGAFQTAMIMKEPLPTQGYEDGLYPQYVRREQDGKVFKPSGYGKMKTGLYNKPTFLVGEGPGDGPEMIIDKRAYAGLSAETKNALLRELSSVRGFENGMYNNVKNRYEVPAATTTQQTASSDSDMLAAAITIIAQNNEFLRGLRENPLFAVVSSKDWRSVKEMQTAIKTLTEIEDKSKKG